MVMVLGTIPGDENAILDSGRAATWGRIYRSSVTGHSLPVMHFHDKYQILY